MMFSKRTWHFIFSLGIITTGCSIIFIGTTPLELFGLTLAIIAGMSCITLVVTLYFVADEEEREPLKNSMWLTMLISALILMAYGAFYPISKNYSFMASAVMCNLIFPIMVIIMAGIIWLIQKNGQS